MRKKQKQEILEFITSLYEAHKEIGIALEQSKYLEGQNMLCECQEYAIELGNIIESMEGDEVVTISYIEKYCELLYRYYEKLSTIIELTLLDNQNLSKEINDVLNTQLSSIENSIKEDIKIKKEIVFLPYKASMWDSLESVYLAAKEDENCDVYVVPIPYFDKNSDGTFKEMYYEANQYPEYVTVTHYNDYQFEVRCPDVIFIHNPYDEWNSVTSVHPFFYSKNLKKFTKQLVYIPYFITPDVLPEELCITPGCINADIIIVQSEEVKENYISAFEKLHTNVEKKTLFKNLNQKIIALGSPKLEKAYKCTKDNYGLPHSWKKLVKRQDGTFKNIIFYNTSLGAILKNRESYLQKLRQVLDIFQENKDVVLWWRPHPLSESTINAVCPEIYEEYKKIVRDYKNGNWGIYDESPDLYRAIAWSDAYYGDKSSVTMLFTAAQKPVMLQLVKEYTLAFENIVKVNKDYWFTSIGYNALFRLKEGTNKAEFISCFNEEVDTGRLYLDIVHYQNKLFFIPLRANAIAIYTIDTKEFKYISINVPKNEEKEGVKYSINSKFTFASINGNSVYLFPSTYPAIVKLDMDSYEVEYLYEPINVLRKWIQKEEGIYFRTGIVQGDVVKMWCEPAKAIVEFNMQSNQIEICAQLSNIGEYIEMTTDGEFYWIIPRDKNAELLKVSKDYKNIEFIKLPEGIVKDAISYIKGICLEDCLLVIPAAAEHVVKLSLKDSTIEFESLFDGEKLDTIQIRPTDWKFFLGKKIDNKVFLFNNFTQEFIIYDTESKEINKNQITTGVNQSLRGELLLDVLMLERGEWKEELSTYFYEDCRGTLHAYIDLLQKSKKRMIKLLQCKWKESKHYIKGTVNENAGKNIYEYVMTR